MLYIAYCIQQRRMRSGIEESSQSDARRRQCCRSSTWCVFSSISSLENRSRFFERQRVCKRRAQWLRVWCVRACHMRDNTSSKMIARISKYASGPLMKFLSLQASPSRSNVSCKRIEHNVSNYHNYVNMQWALKSKDFSYALQNCKEYDLEIDLLRFKNLAFTKTPTFQGCWIRYYWLACKIVHHVSVVDHRPWIRMNTRERRRWYISAHDQTRRTSHTHESRSTHATSIVIYTIV